MVPRSTKLRLVLLHIHTKSRIGGVEGIIVVVRAWTEHTQYGFLTTIFLQV